LESSNSFPEQAQKLRMLNELLNPSMSFCFWIRLEHWLCKWQRNRWNQCKYCKKVTKTVIVK